MASFTLQNRPEINGEAWQNPKAPNAGNEATLLVFDTFKLKL